MTTDGSVYNDAYPSCEYTHVTLRIYSEDIGPDEMSRLLSLTPSSLQRKGDVRNPTGRRPVTVNVNGWFLTSKGAVESKDARRHIDWLLDSIGDCSKAIRALLERGARADITCLWISASGNGGPTLSPNQCRRLATLGTDIAFDVYVGDIASHRKTKKRGKLRVVR